jgi:diguanylate cyclase (GGDEF)-like protein
MFRRNALTSAMYAVLLTLYLLTVGTLLASAGMTFWEHQSNPGRSKELRILAVGYATLAVGCAAVFFRRDLPGAVGSAISNLVILTGYLVVLHGIAALSGRQYRAGSAALLIAMALAWVVGGAQCQDVVWNYVSALPIAVASAMMAYAMLRCEAMKSLQSRRIVAVVTGIHALLYAGRAIVLPWLVIWYGQSVQSIASQITMYEGVLYSFILPMTLLKLIREETHGHLLRESQTDYLTRLGNRRWFFEEGARVIQDRREHGPVSVLAFDLDQFKAINDTHGHKTGDDVLKIFARILHGVVGTYGIPARIGGEEFAVLLSGDEAMRARVLGVAVAIRFAETVADPVDGVGVPATVSIGLAHFENEVPALGDVLAAADRALYKAKSLGGNQLCS